MQKDPNPPKSAFAPAETHGLQNESSLGKTSVFCELPIAGESKSASSSPTKSDTSQKGVERSVGGYRLHKLVGEGGIGRVFQASDESGHMIAIKLLSPELARPPEALERFKLEGVSASANSHPHCVFVHGADEDNGTPYIPMELMKGQSFVAMPNRIRCHPGLIRCQPGLADSRSKGRLRLVTRSLALTTWQAELSSFRDSTPALTLSLTSSDRINHVA